MADQQGEEIEGFRRQMDERITLEQEPAMEIESELLKNERHGRCHFILTPPLRTVLAPARNGIGSRECPQHLQKHIGVFIDAGELPGSRTTC